MSSSIVLYPHTTFSKRHQFRLHATVPLLNSCNPSVILTLFIKKREKIPLYDLGGLTEAQGLPF